MRVTLICCCHSKYSNQLPYISNTHFNIPYTPRFCKWFLLSGFPYQNLLCISVPYPAHISHDLTSLIQFGDGYK